jgi:integrase
MRTGYGSSARAADLAEILATTGLRLSEAVALTWGDVNWEKREIKTAGAKWRRASQTQASVRYLPFYPRLETVLKRLYGEGKAADRRIAPVRDARGTLRTHCEKLKLPRLHHHDHRHLFATWALEAGMDVPTVAAWLGHRDGGALLMRTYNHVRNEHMRASAQKLG